MFDPSSLDRPAGRLLLANAFRAAWYYDATEAAFDRIIEAGSALETFAARTAQGDTRDEREANAMAALRRSGKPVTVDRLLALAMERVHRAVVTGRLDMKPEQIEFVLLPPGTGYIRPPGDGPVNKFEPPRIAKRAQALIDTFIQNGMFVEDMVIRVGQVPPGSLRSQAYTYIGLPRYEREILVCDEVGNASFVGKGMRGEAFWATYRKEHLAQFPDIARVVNMGDTEARILDLVLNGNPVLPKATVGRMPKRPLTDDIVLIHMLRHAEATGQLAVKESGPVITLPGETWSAIDTAYHQQGRGLGREGITSVVRLARAYGLKNGYKDNPEAITEALNNLRNMGHHGLALRDQQEYEMSLPFILTHCLHQAIRDYDSNISNGLERIYVLPGNTNGPIGSIPGQTFKNSDAWIKNNSSLNGLNDLYRAAGLMFESTDNPETVRTACERLRATGAHGLDIGDPQQGRLTLDEIINAGLRYAQASPDGKLPSHQSGSVIGYPGQTWNNWQHLVRTRPELWLDNKPWTGIAEIFQRFGLKEGQRTVPERVAEGLANLERTGHHGLKPVDVTASPGTAPLAHQAIGVRRPVDGLSQVDRPG